jgi:nucleotide-binding universal stress UspA family protein
MYRNILIPIAFDSTEDTEKALKLAHQLAAEGAGFTVMHVVETIPGYVRGQVSEETIATRRDEMKTALKEAAAKLPGAKPHLANGHAAQVIVSFASENDIDCIILSSHTGRLESFFLGSTATSVVSHASCSVHVIR